MSVFISDAPAVSSSTRWPTRLGWPQRLAIVGVLTVVLTLAIVIQGPDSRDVAVRVGSGSKPVASSGARAAQPSLDALATRLDAQIAAPWPSLQQPTGRFRNILGGGTRYGEATGLRSTPD